MSTPAAHDREKTPPFLLKLFYRQNDFHRLEDFTPGGQLPRHLQIYTWPSCTLRELTHLLTSAMPNLLPAPAAGTRIAFRLVYPDTRPGGRPDGPGRFMMKDLGSVVVGESGTTHANGDGDLSDSKEKDDRPLDGDADKMLSDAKFVIGDFVSCAIIPPLPSGYTAPPPGPRHMRPGPSRGGVAGGAYRGRGNMRAFPPSGDYHASQGASAVPRGDWRRGERLPDGPGYGNMPPDASYRRQSRQQRW